MTPADRATVAKLMKRTSTLFKKSGAKLILVAQVGNPYLRGRDPVWPIPAFYIIDSMDSLP